MIKIKVINDSSHYCIAVNPSPLPSDGITGSKSRRRIPRTVYDFIWTTQNRWASNNANKQKFVSYDDAKDFLDFNRASMENLLHGKGGGTDIISLKELDEKQNKRLK